MAKKIQLITLQRAKLKKASEIDYNKVSAYTHLEHSKWLSEWHLNTVFGVQIYDYYRTKRAHVYVGSLYIGDFDFIFFKIIDKPSYEVKHIYEIEENKECCKAGNDIPFF